MKGDAVFSGLFLFMNILMILSSVLVSEEKNQQFLPDDLVHHNILTDFLQSVSDFILRHTDYSAHPTVSIVIFTTLVFIISLGVGFMAKWIILRLTFLIGNRLKSTLFNELHNFKFFTKLSYLVPEFTFEIFIRYSYESSNHLAVFFSNLAVLAILFTMGLSVNAFLDAVWTHLDARTNKKKLPLKGIVQLLKGIVWIVVVIICVALIIDKSPLALLGGLGAFAAVLMLIFKDSILGVVASVQLSEYDVLHIGDWIKVPGTDANGTVEETNLISVKVKNWDKTTTIVPSYSLVSGSFTNYSSMSESRTRRIDRTLYIDAETVRRADDDLLAQIRKIPFMADYIDGKLKLQAEGKDFPYQSGDIVGGTIDTNLGLFRAYVKLYIDASPCFDHSDTSMVFLNQQTPSGYPMNIYCFTSTSKWDDYEMIQSAFFEHLAVMLPLFGLTTFENESTRNGLMQAAVEAGMNPQNLFGVPEPFFLDKAASEKADK